MEKRSGSSKIMTGTDRCSCPRRIECFHDQLCKEVVVVVYAVVVRGGANHCPLIVGISGALILAIAVVSYLKNRTVCSGATQGARTVRAGYECTSLR